MRSRGKGEGQLEGRKSSGGGGGGAPGSKLVDRPPLRDPDTHSNNPIRLMHDVIHLMPYICTLYTWNEIKRQVKPVLKRGR